MDSLFAPMCGTHKCSPHECFAEHYPEAFQKSEVTICRHNNPEAACAVCKHEEVQLDNSSEA